MQNKKKIEVVLPTATFSIRWLGFTYQTSNG